MRKAQNDPTNPTYYKDRPIEVIECLRSLLQGHEGYDGFLIGNLIKYVTRFKEKNGLEDLSKAQWYLNRLIDEHKED